MGNPVKPVTGSNGARLVGGFDLSTLGAEPIKNKLLEPPVEHIKYESKLYSLQYLRDCSPRFSLLASRLIMEGRPGDTKVKISYAYRSNGVRCIIIPPENKVYKERRGKIYL